MSIYQELPKIRFEIFIFNSYDLDVLIKLVFANDTLIFLARCIGDAYL